MGRTAAATKEPPKFLRVADVAAMLDISESHAYKIMRQLNKELKAKGKIVTAGRVSRRYLEEVPLKRISCTPSRTSASMKTKSSA